MAHLIDLFATHFLKTPRCPQALLCMEPRRLAVHHTTGPANKVLAKGDPDLESSKPPVTHTKSRPFITRALRVTLPVPVTSQPARPWLASSASQHHT